MKTKTMVVCRENRKLIQRTVRDVVQRTLAYNEHFYCGSLKIPSIFQGG